MSEKPKETQTVNLKEMLSQAASEAVEKYANSQKQAPASQVQQESLEPKGQIEIFNDYKPKLLEMLKSTREIDNFSWSSKTRQSNVRSQSAQPQSAQPYLKCGRKTFSDVAPTPPQLFSMHLSLSGMKTSRANQATPSTL